MFTIDQNLFYLLCLLFGLFWVIVEGFIAYWVYRSYRLLDKHLNHFKAAK